MVTWMISLAALAAIDAPVREVTVYSDRARVVREAPVNVTGAQVLELPLLVETVDTSTLRVEAQGAEVRRVDIDLVDAQDVPSGEATALLQKLEQLDDQIALADAQRSAIQAQVQDLQRITPAMPPPDPLKLAPRLQPGGWSAALAAVDGAEAKLRARIAELDVKLEGLQRERQAAAHQAQILGGAERKAGYRVKVLVEGRGPAKLIASYMVDRARWLPAYDIQYLPKEGRVQISFAGLVSQESGEDWNDAHLTLSTAVPASVTTLPKLLSWKIGERERFIPTPVARIEPPRPPPPPYPPMPEMEGRAESLRSRLLAAAGPRGPEDRSKSSTIDFEDDTISGDLLRPDAAWGAPASPPPPPPRPSPQVEMAEPMLEDMLAAPAEEPAGESAEESIEEIVVMGSRTEHHRPPEPPALGIGLGPPLAYRPPPLPENSAAAAAGGYDLFYRSARAETVGSGQGARRVALFARQWPVTVERKIFPALVPEAFLVAELKNPSDQPLPAGNASLFVGEDPAGMAQLELVSPGEQLTLPLGLDRAIRAIRNVRLVQTEIGFIIGKEEVGEYVVSIELVNPYPVSVPITVVDQVPVTDDRNVEVKLLKTVPAVTEKDDLKGSLEWKLTLAPGGKSVVSFNYTIKRPKSWRLHQ